MSGREWRRELTLGDLEQFTKRARAYGATEETRIRVWDPGRQEWCAIDAAELGCTIPMLPAGAEPDE